MFELIHPILAISAAIVLSGAFYALRKGAGSLFWAPVSKLRQMRATGLGQKDIQAEFYVNGTVVSRMSPAAKIMMQETLQQHEDMCWADVHNVLSQDFKTLPSDISEIITRMPFVLQKDTSTGYVQLECKMAGKTFICIVSHMAASEQALPVARHSKKIPAHRLDSMLENAPILMWGTNKKGAVIWRNKAYLNLLIELGEEGREDDIFLDCQILNSTQKYAIGLKRWIKHI
ncbi:MAG: hypothetical protein ACPGVK_04050 [Halocynthiibacter sp.]